MGNLTIRRVDEALKQRLRIQAARNGRSMEDEVRQILAARLADEPAPAGVEAKPSKLAPFDSSAQGSEPAEPADSRGNLSLQNRRILLVIGGGIAAYKSLDLIRRLKERGAAVRVVLTRAAQEFVTPLSAGALAGEPPYTDLFDQRMEFDVGHIRLARDTDLVIVAPATADFMAKMAGGHADDLASAVLLATDKPVLLAPAMNPHMWNHAATQRNLATLIGDGITTVGPNAGEMAESGEAGTGRMAEPLQIVAAVETRLRQPAAVRALAGRRIVITSGPTHEPIDPVRYIANRSSGKQGHAIAQAAAALGADVVLISGPVAIADPPGVRVIKVETAQQMLEAVEAALPVDAGVFAAAVADWRVADAGTQKIKKTAGAATPSLSFVENPDILATVAHHPTLRPPLVIGFAAETQNVIDYATAKLRSKGCDWIVANDVSPDSGVMGGDSNSVHLVSAAGVESWPQMSKPEVAARLVLRMADALKKESR